MALIDRLLATDSTKIAIHTFAGMLGELKRGKVTTQNVIDAFTLGAADVTELNALLAKMVTPLESISLGGSVTLTNVGAAYDATNLAWGLGFCRLEGAGVTGFDVRLGMNRNGSTGAISWQLWDVTNSAELARIDDAVGAATGNKMLSTSVSFAAWAPGVRELRMRVKSTIAADDPIYHGSNLHVSRAGRLTSVEFQEIIMLAENRRIASPYSTVAAVRTRLGL